jgi:prepilin-type N-terminal cleavage/methylation domain-containing protein
MLWRHVRQTGDAPASLRDGGRHRSERGFSLLELLAGLGLLGVVVGIAALQMPRGAYALWGAQTELLGDLRGVRADALTKGEHFRLTVVDASSYRVERMQLDGTGNWVPRTPPLKERTLPAGVTFTTGVGNFFEFNTRGLMVNPSWAQTLNLYDGARSLNRWVTVWPSGQVAPGS